MVVMSQLVSISFGKFPNLTLGNTTDNFFPTKTINYTNRKKKNSKLKDNIQGFLGGHHRNLYAFTIYYFTKIVIRAIEK